MTDEQKKRVEEIRKAIEWNDTNYPNENTQTCVNHSALKSVLSIIDEQAKEIERLKSDLTEAKDNWEHFADLHKEAQVIQIPKLLDGLESQLNYLMMYPVPSMSPIEIIKKCREIAQELLREFGRGEEPATPTKGGG